MTQFNSSKYSVAWYKLSEFVIKKEKERALGILRLLVHSLNDNAFAAQLEGDLLWSFQDIKATDCYIRAANLYEKQSKNIEAVAIYEHLLNIFPDSLNSVEYLQKLLSLYQVLKNNNKIYLSWCSLVDILLKKDMKQEVNNLCEQANNIFPDPLIIHQHMVLALIINKKADQKLLEYHIKRALDYFIQENNTGLNNFMARLSALAPEEHIFAYEALKKMDYKK